MENIPKKERSYELDWLRIVATIFIFFFHSARAFDIYEWEISNNEPDPGLIIQYLCKFLGYTSIFYYCGDG